MVHNASILFSTSDWYSSTSTQPINNVNDNENQNENENEDENENFFINS